MVNVVGLSTVWNISGVEYNSIIYYIYYYTRPHDQRTERLSYSEKESEKKQRGKLKKLGFSNFVKRCSQDWEEACLAALYLLCRIRSSVLKRHALDLNCNTKTTDSRKVGNYFICYGVKTCFRKWSALQKCGVTSVTCDCRGGRCFISFPNAGWSDFCINHRSLAVAVWLVWHFDLWHKSPEPSVLAGGTMPRLQETMAIPHSTSPLQLDQ